MSKIPVGTVVTSVAKFRSKAYKDFVRGLDETPERRRTVSRGDRFGPFKVLHPHSVGAAARADDFTTVLSLESSRNEILLCSDLGVAGQKALAESGLLSQASVVVSGLPAVGEPLGDPLLERAKPRVILLTSAGFPNSQRPSSALRARLSEAADFVLTADREGGFQMETTADGLEIRSRAGARILLPPK